MSVHRLARLIVGLLVAMIVAALASTTTAGAATFIYDVPAVARVDTSEFGTADASWDITGRARRAVAGDAAATAQLRDDFTRMGGVQARLEAVREFIPAANDGIQVAGAMANLSRVGLEALNLIGRRATADANWSAGADSTLASLTGRPISQWILVPTATAAVRVLVDAAKGLPPPRN